MPLSFPSSPAVNQTATLNGRQYRWTGSAWEFVASGGGSDSRFDYFKPLPPASVTAVGGNAQASVSWPAATTVNVLPVTDYVVEFKAAGSSEWQNFSDGTSTATSATVTALDNGTGYTFRVAGVNAIGQGEYSTASNSVTPADGDQYFANVSLLIHGDGSGSNFVDLSGSPKTITAYGNATQSSDQSKWGGKSIYLDGSGDYLTIPVSSAFEFGTSDFSIEFWARLSSGNNWQRVIGLGQGANANGPYTAWSVALSGNYVRFYRFDDNEYLYDANVQLSQAQWYHIAVTRASGVLKIFVDGTEVGSWSGVNGVSLNRRNEDPVYIGRVIGGMGDAYFSGYIDDLRVTKGVARTITVPIGPYPDSTASSSVTPSGDPNWNDVRLLFHADGANNSTSFTNTTGNAITLSARGSAVVSTAQAKFGSGSLYVPSSGTDGLNINNAGSLLVFTGDYTIEFWMYFSSIATDSSVYVNHNGGDSYHAVNINSSSYSLYFNTSSPTNITHSLQANQWNHVAIVRSGSTVSAYTNGSRVGTATSSGTHGNASPSSARIASANDASYYVDEFRVTAVARYSGESFTVPIGPYPDSTASSSVTPSGDPNWSDVVLLLHADGTGSTFTDSSLTPKTITANGNATQSTSQSKWGGKSAYFDGDADYLSIAAASGLNLGTGDWTIELWARCQDQNKEYPSWLATSGGWSSGSFAIQFDQNANQQKVVVAWNGGINNGISTIYSASTFSFNAWRHIAVVRSGSTLTLYVDGVSEASSSIISGAALDLAYGGSLRIGGSFDGNDSYINDFIDDIRVTKGVARTITVPIGPYPDS
jgi:hypothetical protein